MALYKIGICEHESVKNKIVAMKGKKTIFLSLMKRDFFTY